MLNNREKLAIYIECANRIDKGEYDSCCQVLINISPLMRNDYDNLMQETQIGKGKRMYVWREFVKLNFKEFYDTYAKEEPYWFDTRKERVHAMISMAQYMLQQEDIYTKLTKEERIKDYEDAIKMAKKDEYWHIGPSETLCMINRNNSVPHIKYLLNTHNSLYRWFFLENWCENVYPEYSSVSRITSHEEGELTIIGYMSAIKFMECAIEIASGDEPQIKKKENKIISFLKRIF